MLKEEGEERERRRERRKKKAFCKKERKRGCKRKGWKKEKMEREEAPNSHFRSSIRAFDASPAGSSRPEDS